MIKRTKTIIILAALIILGLSGCNQEERYEWQGQNWEDMLLLFEEQKPMFTEIAIIFSTNDVFFEECRQYEDDYNAWLMSPYDDEKMGVFSINNQEIVTSFFEQTRPYSVIVDWECVKIDYINEENGDAFAFVYYFGDNLDEWIRYAKGRRLGTIFIDLGDNWFAYMPKESSQQ